MPVLYSTRGWGLFLHSSFRSQWEVGSFSYTGGSVLVEDGRLDLFLMAAPTLKGLVGTYTALTGRPAMPPLWAFGTWVSRCQFFTAAEAEESMRGFRELGMPADVIHLDPLWMTTHWYWKIGVDACDFEWNEAGFPDHAALFAAWRAQGWDICLWINPYLPEAKPIYAEAQAAGFLLRDVRGGIARLSHGEPVGMIDVTNPAARAWWQGRLEQLLRDGASVLKPDYGDRVPETALAHNGMTGAELHNLYLHLYAEICFEARRNVHGQPVVWRRAGYVGSQRFAGCWAGDTQTTWEAFRCCLRGGLSAGFTGDGFWSHDIGGFCGPVPSPELYIRWMQVGLLSPFARFHGNRLCEPWHYGAQAVAVAQRYTRLRYRLVPYLLACASEACATGIPIQRHCLLEFPGEPGLHALDDQILLGPDLLLLPVLEPGATSRQAYLPTGRWYDYDDPAVSYDGGRWHTIPAPLDRIPLLVREGAIIPRYAQDQQHLKEPRPAEIEVAVWPGDRPHQVRCDDGAGAVHVVRDAQGLRIAAGARPVALRTMAQ
jgi:alpha-D-xyloside xylohydrolase